MIEEPPLLTIKRPSRRPTQAQIDAFRGLPASVVSDAMEGAGAMEASICPVEGGRLLPPAAVGPALTVDCGPADILALIAALKFVEPGDIVVSGMEGFANRAQLGDRVTEFLKNCGAAGVVTDGPVRDLDGIVPLGLPIWCRGLSPATPFMNGPGRIGLPAQVGGQRVETGDLIVADRDGVVVVPFDRIDEVAARAHATLALEQDLARQLADGLKYPDTIDALLAGDRVRWID